MSRVCGHVVLSSELSLIGLDFLLDYVCWAACSSEYLLTWIERLQPMVFLSALCRQYPWTVAKKVQKLAPNLSLLMGRRVAFNAP